MAVKIFTRKIKRMEKPLLPLIVEPKELEDKISIKELLIVDLNEPSVYERGHIPRAINLPFTSLIAPRPPAMGTIPNAESLSSTLSSIGLDTGRHVVAYDSEGTGKASRFLWTLDVVGHPKISLLNGGFHSWAGEGYPLEIEINASKPSEFRAKIGNTALAGKDYILDHLGDDEVVILDCRSPAEYKGEDLRASRGGHIPGAINFDWMLAVDRDRNFRLKEAEEINKLLIQLGVTPDKEVIMHCQTHHRSSHTYLVLKSLGYKKIKGYDGSWSEWGNDPGVPIER